MIGVPSYHAIAAMGITIAMFIAFARGRMSVEIISLMTIAVIAVGLYFFPHDDTQPIHAKQILASNDALHSKLHKLLANALKA